MPKVETPETLKCPMSRSIFTEPVVAEDGYTYERKVIEKWIAEKGTSPLTAEKISNKLIINQKKKNEVLSFIENNKFCTIEQFLRTFIEAMNAKNLNILQKLNYPDFYLKCVDGITDTPLHMAVSCGYKEMVNWLADELIDHNVKNGCGQTPMHMARHPEVAQLLLGADLRARDNKGRTPLHIAAFAGNSEMVKWLLLHCADPTIEDNEGYTPLDMLDLAFDSPSSDYSVYQEDYNRVGYLLGKTKIWCMNKVYDPRILHLAISYNQVEEMKKLIWGSEVLFEYDLNLDGKNDAGEAPLHLACFLGYKKMVKLLLKSRANPNVKNPSGDTPLHVAARRGHVEIVRLLLDKGADCKEVNNLSETALQIAEKNGKREAVRLLQINEAPQRISALENIIKEQQKRINELDKHLQTHLQLTQKKPETQESLSFTKDVYNKQKLATSEIYSGSPVDSVGKEKLRKVVNKIVPNRDWKISSDGKIWLQPANEEEAQAIVNHFKQSDYNAIEFNHRKDAPNIPIIILENADYNKLIKISPLQILIQEKGEEPRNKV